MTSYADLQRWQQAFKSRIPVLGSRARRKAVGEMAKTSNNRKIIPMLIQALDSNEEDVSAAAREALMDLHDDEAIEALCDTWSKSRNPHIEEILLSRKYLPKKPVSLHVLVALRLGNHFGSVPRKALPFFIHLLQDQDEAIRAKAEKSLRKIPPGPARDGLCDLAVEAPCGPAAKIVTDEGFRHSDPERHCVMLFVTRQFDQYFEEDDGFRNLQAQYDQGNEQFKARILDVIRSGDRRCTGFFGTKTKPLSECSDREIGAAINGWQEHKEYDKLFAACLELPLHYGIPIVESLRRAQWSPDDLKKRTLLETLVRELDDAEIPPRRKPSGGTSLFEAWLANGSEQSGQGEVELLSRLKSATPPEGVQIVGALAANGLMSNESIEAVLHNPHWLVRLAARATGIGANQFFIRDAKGDSVFWVTELMRSTTILDFAPTMGTPADLRRPKHVPRRAFAGRLAGARRALQAILAHRRAESPRSSGRNP